MLFVGKNSHLFKLPELRQLRASLHPLILEQMKNYNTIGSEANRPKKRQRKKDDDDDIRALQKKKLADLEEEYINQVKKNYLLNSFFF